MADALMHPFSDPSHGEQQFVKLVRAEGSTVWDESGKAYIDGVASLWYCQVGHARPELLDAISGQLDTLATYNIFAPFTNGPAAAAAEAVAAVSPMPDGRVFFGCSGSEAIDTALKIARTVAQINGEHERQIIVTRTRGYHGTNFGGTSAQGIAHNRAGWGDLVPHFVEVAADDLEGLATIFASDGERIAAVLTEPVQGAGGVFLPPDGYLQGLRRLCDDNGALLIFDEVINGFGRTGEWFASEHYGVTPDLITFAKGVTSGYQPVSGVVLSRAVAEVLESRGEVLRTGYTYSGHPMGMAAVVANIAVIRDAELRAAATRIGDQFEAGLHALAADGGITGFEGIGALWGVELGRDALPVRAHMLDNGVIVRPLGTRIGLCPPLVATPGEIGRIVDALAAAVEATG